MSTVTFRIKAEDAQAVAAFARMTEAEKVITLEAMKADSAMRKQASTALELGTRQEKLAQALEKLTAKQQALNASDNASAKEKKELAKQIEIVEKRLTKVNQDIGDYVMKSDRATVADQHAARAKKDVSEAARKQGDDIARSGRAAQDASGGLDMMGGAAASLISKAAGILSVGAALTFVGQEALSAQEHLAAMGRKGEESAASLKALIGIQESAAAGDEYAKKAVLAGAQHGLSVQQTAAIFQPLQSTVGAETPEQQAELFARFDAAAKMTSLGVEAEDANDIANLGVAQGMRPGQIEDLIALGADESRYEEKDFARAASTLNMFSDAEEGIAAVTALSTQGIQAKRLPEMTRAIANTLGESADNSDFSKKYKLKGLSESDKIQKLRQIAIEKGDQSLSEEDRIKKFSKGLQNDGMDTLAAEGIGALIRSGDVFENTEQKLRRMTGEAPLTEQEALERIENGQMFGAPSLLDAKYQKLQDSKVEGPRMDAERAAAMQEANNLFGPESDKARDVRRDKLTRGQQRLQDGQSKFVDETTGEENFRGQVGGAINATAGYVVGSLAWLTGSETLAKRHDEITGNHLDTTDWTVKPKVTGLDETIAGTHAVMEQGGGGESKPEWVDEIIKSNQSVVDSNNKNSETTQQNTEAMRTGAAPTPTTTDKPINRNLNT